MSWFYLLKNILKTYFRKHWWYYCTTLNNFIKAKSDSSAQVNTECNITDYQKMTIYPLSICICVKTAFIVCKWFTLLVLFLMFLPITAHLTLHQSYCTMPWVSLAYEQTWMSTHYTEQTEPPYCSQEKKKKLYISFTIHDCLKNCFKTFQQLSIRCPITFYIQITDI